MPSVWWWTEAEILDQSRVVGREHPAGANLQQPGRDQQRRARRGAAQPAGHHEGGRDDQEHPAPAEEIPSRPATPRTSPKVSA